MSLMEDTLSLLMDGEWHTDEEISKKLGTKKDKISKVLDFFSKYEFVEYDSGKRKAKATHDALMLR